MLRLWTQERWMTVICEICEIWIFSLLSCHCISGTEMQRGRSVQGCDNAITPTLPFAVLDGSWLCFNTFAISALHPFFFSAHNTVVLCVQHNLPLPILQLSVLAPFYDNAPHTPIHTCSFLLLSYSFCLVWNTFFFVSATTEATSLSKMGSNLSLCSPLLLILIFLLQLPPVSVLEVYYSSAESTIISHTSAQGEGR